MEKFAYIDVETTGTDPKKHAIVQFGAIIEIDGRVENRVNLNMAPYKGDEINQEALDVIGYSKEEILEYPNLSEQWERLKSTLSEHVDPYDRSDKFHFVAYNARFDDSFVREWWNKEGDNYYGSFFYYPAIDLTNLVALRYCHVRDKFPNYKLMTVCKTLGMDVSEDEAHDAFYDIKCTRELFIAMRKMVGWDDS